jgi:hypothetical protein
MAGIVLDADAAGLFGLVTCEREGCQAHVALRPGAPDVSGLELITAVFDVAAEEGWRFDRVAWCPRHVPRRLRRAETVGSGYDWSTVVKVAR